MTTLQSDDVDAASNILRVLEAKAFYKERFYKQIQAMYPTLGGDKNSRAAPLIHLRELLASVPDALTSDTAFHVKKYLVDVMKECPSPAIVLEVIAQSALKSANLDFDALYERAKKFLAFPPESQEVADRWIERIIYTTVSKIGRERFSVISPTDWQQEVTRIMMSGELRSYSVTQQKPVEATRHDFKVLLKKLT